MLMVNPEDADFVVLLLFKEIFCSLKPSICIALPSCNNLLDLNFIE